jgi:cytoskeleton protein RodZ
MPVDTDSLGSYLRRGRELRKKSLQDISAATKIQLKFLEALERDDYDQLPPVPFVVGFLRAYAQCLSLDPEEIIATYHTRHSSAEGGEGPPLLVAYQVRRPTRSRLVGVSLFIVAGALGVGLALQSLLPHTSDETSPTAVSEVSESLSGNARIDAELPPTVSKVSPILPVEPGPPASQALPAVIPEVKQEQHAATPSAPPTPAVLESPRLVPTERSSVDPPSRFLTLQAVAVQDTWLRVEIDGNKRHDVLLNSGKTAHWEAQHHFLMTIGNARGIRLTLNGQEVTLPPGRSNIVRDFQITRTFLDAR